jgi:hypothetical protein
MVAERTLQIDDVARGHCVGRGTRSVEQHRRRNGRCGSRPPRAADRDVRSRFARYGLVGL